MTRPMQKTNKRTPRDTTEFEREQLRFFLSGENISVALAEFNPSLAWLPELVKMNIIQESTQVAFWIERNFHDPDAVREVAANIRFFREEGIADFLEHKLTAIRAAAGCTQKVLAVHNRTYTSSFPTAFQKQLV